MRGHAQFSIDQSQTVQSLASTPNDVICWRTICLQAALLSEREETKLALVLEKQALEDARSARIKVGHCIFKRHLCIAAGNAQAIGWVVTCCCEPLAGQSCLSSDLLVPDTGMECMCATCWNTMLTTMVTDTLQFARKVDLEYVLKAILS